MPTLQFSLLPTYFSRNTTVSYNFAIYSGSPLHRTHRRGDTLLQTPRAYMNRPYKLNWELLYLRFQKLM